MKTRKEAAYLINKQMQDGLQADIRNLVKEASGFESYQAPVKTCTHYGTLELRELMDYIYEGKPESENEFISNN